MIQQSKIFKLVEKRAAMTLSWMVIIMVIMVTPSLADPLDSLFQNLSLNFDASDHDFALSAGERDLEGQKQSIAGTYFIKEVDIDIMGFQFNYSAETDHGIFAPYVRLEWIRDQAIPSRKPSLVKLPPLNEAVDSGIPLASDGLELNPKHFNFGIGVMSVLPYGVMAFFDYETTLTPEEQERAHLISVGLRLAY